MGDVVLVKLESGVYRPMLVSAVVEVELFDSDHDPHATVRRERRLNGTICCEPADHTTKAFRGGLDNLKDPARIHGRPDRQLSTAYGEALAEGEGIGQWRRRS